MEQTASDYVTIQTEEREQHGHTLKKQSMQWHITVLVKRETVTENQGNPANLNLGRTNVPP